MVNDSRQTQTIHKGRLVLEAPVAPIPAQPNLVLAQAELSFRRQSSALTIAPPTQIMLQQHQRTMQIVQQQRLPTFFVGYAPAFTGLQLYRGQDSDWTLMNLRDEALFQVLDNNMVLPHDVAEDVFRLHDAGIDFEAIYIAHEIPAGVLPDNATSVPLELIVPPPSDRQRRMNRLGDQSERLLGGLGKVVGKSLQSVKKGAEITVRASITVGAAVGQAVDNEIKAAQARAEAARIRRETQQAERRAEQARQAAARAAANNRSSSDYSYDPILFGLFLDKSNLVNGRPIALWYYISSWDWTPQ